MLKRLYLRNFTVFEDADFEFGPGLNVIVGANGTGKSHVLKAGYAIIFSMLDAFQKEGERTNTAIGKSLYNIIEYRLRGAIEGKLKSVFRPVPYSTSLLNRGGKHASTARIDVTLTDQSGETRTSVLFSDAYVDTPPIHRSVSIKLVRINYQDLRVRVRDKPGVGCGRAGYAARRPPP